MAIRTAILMSLAGVLNLAATYAYADAIAPARLSRTGQSICNTGASMPNHAVCGAWYRVTFADRLDGVGAER